MKIKEACSKTGLTERTIRFYIEKNLISPSSAELNGRIYYDYSEQDIENLKQISLLRKIGLSIENILDMQSNPENINSILGTHISLVSEKRQELSKVIAILEKTRGLSFSSVHELTEALNSDVRDIPLPFSDIKPNFGKFDNETSEEREKGYLDFLVHQRIREKIERFSNPLKNAAKILGCLLLALAAIYAFSCIPRTISLEHQGLRFRVGNPESDSTTVNISIKGKMYSKLFSSPVFKGTIELDSVDYTKDATVEVAFFGDDKTGWLVYHTIVVQGDEVKPVTHSFALLWADKNFAKTVFYIFENTQNSSKELKNLVICTPASNRKEGMQILSDMKLLDKFNSYIDKSQ